MPRLKVFCTTSGFHDSVVAAPSRPAALKAWGAKTDLFSMGAARQVTDRKIVEKALARPGEVIRFKRSEGSEAPDSPKRKKKAASRPPSRAMLKSAEEKLAALRERQDSELGAIERQIEALEEKRDLIASRHAKARATAERKAERAREDYEAALTDWDG